MLSPGGHLQLVVSPSSPDRQHGSLRGASLCDECGPSQITRPLCSLQPFIERSNELVRIGDSHLVDVLLAGSFSLGRVRATTPTFRASARTITHRGRSLLSFFSTLDAVDWIALIGGAVGVVGGIAGVIGAIASFNSNKIAKGARQDSKTANEFAAEANGISREANRIAVGANEISEESKLILKRSEAIQTERNDVDWEPSWEGPGKLVLTNGGQDEALGVKATVWVDGTKFDASAERVSGRGGRIEINPADLGHRFINEVLQTRRETGTSPLNIDQSMFLQIHVAFRVVWSTPLGQHRERESKSIPYSFDEVRADGSV